MGEGRASNDDFNPATLARGMTEYGKEATGTGLKDGKGHPVATLRLFTGPEVAEWLLYGGFRGGRQGKGWIEVFYEGILPGDEGDTLGFWRVRIEGDNLEALAHQIGKQVRNSLRVGSEETWNVRAIEVSEMKVADQDSH